MKTKLLRKLRQKFYIIKTNDSYYVVEGSTASSEKITDSLDEARKRRRRFILNEGRTFYHEYSVLRTKRFN
jgi:hypothetical protein